MHSRLLIPFAARTGCGGSAGQNSCCGPHAPVRGVLTLCAFAAGLALFSAFLPSPVNAGPDPGRETAAAGIQKPGRETVSLIVNVSVNREARGDFFVERDPDNKELFFKAEDLVALKLRFPRNRVIAIKGETYAALSAVRDISFTIDENNLTVTILGKTTESKRTEIELSAPGARPKNLYYPHETSAFFNYGLNYSYSDAPGSRSFSFSSKMGARSGNVFFVSDSLYSKTEIDSQFVRLQSSATYERRNDLQWLVLGDQFANSGELGTVVNMGGIGFSKLYRLDPYFITQPMFAINGVSPLPSEADIYLDGLLVGKQQIAPGRFDIRNIYSYTGAHNLDVVLKDPFGNEQRISYPLYFSTQLLREGLHEYSYNVGFLREGFGAESNDYGRPVFSAFHRYGVTNAFNIGARAEATDGVYNGGLTTGFSLPRIGAFLLSLAASSNNGAKGSAVSFQHSYQVGGFNTNVQVREYSRDYAAVATLASPVRMKQAASVSLGFPVRPLGSFSLGYSSNETYGQAATRLVSASYSQQLTRTTSLFVTASRTKDARPVNSFFIGLNFTPAPDVHASVQATRSGDTDTETLQLQKDAPVGEGVGYRASLNRSDTGRSTAASFNPGIQYNGKYGIYTLDSSLQKNNPGSGTAAYTVSAAGSFVYAGGFFAASRPVSDSFSIVMADGLPGAAVTNNGQRIGTTNSSGTMVVPNLASYSQNQLTLDVRNVPLDYSVSGVNQLLSPPVWSGSCVSFDAVRVRALTGSLYNSVKKPLEFVDIVLKVGGREVTFPTGKGGEFYIENRLPDTRPGNSDNRSCRAIAERRKSGANIIKPGTYQARVEYAGERCGFAITFPDSDDAITDTGPVVCTSPGPAPVKPAPSVAPLLPAPARSPKERKDVENSYVIQPVFGMNGAPVFRQDRLKLAEIIRRMKRDARLRVGISVSGDRHGTNEESVRLGWKKADAIRRYLISSGIRPDRIEKIDSLGQSRLLCREPTVDCDRINRRSIITIVPGRASLPAAVSAG